jgi:MFS transporter, DHA1 family, inner membrane transport protein
MTFFVNRDLNHLSAHATLHALAWCFCGLFSALFLLRGGLSIPETFLAFAAMLVLRFALRPLVLALAPAIGLRRTLIVGTLLFALQFPMLAFVHGVGVALGLFCLLAALGDVVYWTTSHALFAALGEIELRGTQVAERQAVGALAQVLGPAAGGIMLAIFGPWPAFMTAFAIELAAIVPLLYIADPPIAREPPRGAYLSARAGIWLFVCDAWIVNTATVAWSILMFRAVGARYDVFGGALAAASLAGAIGGMVLGRFIDRGHALQLTLVNAAVLGGSLVVKAVCGETPLAVVTVAIGTTMLGGLYIPALMSAIYNEAKASPCPLRFHFAAEGGWDAGGTAACLLAAAVCAADAPLQAVILLALPMVAVQYWLLIASYARHGRARAGAATAAPMITGDV